MLNTLRRLCMWFCILQSNATKCVHHLNFCEYDFKSMGHNIPSPSWNISCLSFLSTIKLNRNARLVTLDPYGAKWVGYLFPIFNSVLMTWQYYDVSTWDDLSAVGCTVYTTKTLYATKHRRTERETEWICLCFSCNLHYNIIPGVNNLIYILFVCMNSDNTNPKESSRFIELVLYYTV